MKNLSNFAVSEPKKVGQDSALMVDFSFTRQDVSMTQFNGFRPYSFRQTELNVNISQKFAKLVNRKK